MKTIKLTKVAESATPDFFSGQWKDYVPGEDNGDVSLPIEYTIRGTLIKEPKVGESMQIFRTERNGVEAPGHFLSSPVVEISLGNGPILNHIIETRNSIYIMEYENA